MQATTQFQKDLSLSFPIKIHYIDVSHAIKITEKNSRCSNNKGKEEGDEMVEKGEEKDRQQQGPIRGKWSLGKRG